MNKTWTFSAFQNMKAEISELPHASDTDLWPSFSTDCRRIRSFIFTQTVFHTLQSLNYIFFD